ncbi:hypothetical protein TNCV_2406961, partial [Trichonephila clavipes]
HDPKVKLPVKAYVLEKLTAPFPLHPERAAERYGSPLPHPIVRNSHHQPLTYGLCLRRQSQQAQPTYNTNKSFQLFS